MYGTASRLDFREYLAAVDRNAHVIRIPLGTARYIGQASAKKPHCTMAQPSSHGASPTANKYVAEALRPIVAALLRAGVGAHEATDSLKWLFAHECAAQLRRDGCRVSASRIAAATGLTRAETAELLATSCVGLQPETSRLQRCTRVINGWMSDSDFLEIDGSPRQLSFTGGRKSFQDLARLYSGDIPPRAMLDELLSRAWVLESAPGLFVPSGSFSTGDSSMNSILEDIGWKLGAFGSTLVANMQKDPTTRLFERVIQSDKIDARSRGKVLRELTRRCRVFSQGVERFLLDQEMSTQRGVTATSVPAQIGLVLAVIEQTSSQDSAEQGAATDG
jgi:hypothetical protein